MEKTYLCRQWPSLTIRRIKFTNGLYTTTNPEEQAVIEAADGFGVHILEVPRNTPAEQEVTRARQGGRNSMSLV